MSSISGICKDSYQKYREKSGNYFKKAPGRLAGFSLSGNYNGLANSEEKNSGNSRKMHL